jgi:hypothetical protein
MESGQSILATQLALAQNKDLTITVQKKTVATPADVYALLKLAIKARNSSFANVCLIRINRIKLTTDFRFVKIAKTDVGCILGQGVFQH